MGLSNIARQSNLFSRGLKEERLEEGGGEGGGWERGVGKKDRGGRGNTYECLT